MKDTLRGYAQSTRARRTEASRGQEYRSLASVWRPAPMPCPLSIRIILARDLPTAATVSALPEGWRNDAQP